MANDLWKKISDLSLGSANWGFTIKGALLDLHYRTMGIEEIVKAIAIEHEAIAEHAPKTHAAVAQMVLDGIARDR